MAFFSYLQAKGEYRSEDLNCAATTILDILLHSQQNSAAQVHFTQRFFFLQYWFTNHLGCLSLLAVQARWAAAAAQLLRTWRHQISITVPWRPLYQYVHVSLQATKTAYEGKLLVALLYVKRLQHRPDNMYHDCSSGYTEGCTRPIDQSAVPD